MILRWLDRTRLPVEAEALTPAAFAGLAPADVARRRLHVGNAAAEIGDLFVVEGAADDTLAFEGDLRHVRGIGRGMAAGAVVVRGTAGPYLGAAMSGGTIEVHGDAGDWAGAGMRGGRLRIRGNAGHSLGAAAPGANVGMRDGAILVDGSTGDEAGLRMRRGLIAVGGAAGAGFGRGLVAGSLFAFGGVGRFPGAGMKRGTVALFGPEPPELLPSFTFTGAYRFPFLAVYLRRLREWGFAVPDGVSGGWFGRYNGDRAEGGIGEVLVLRGGDEREATAACS